MSFETTFNNLQLIDVEVSFTDSLGQPVSLFGIPAWEAADPTLVSLSVADDGLSAVVRSTGAIGVTHVTVSATATLGNIGVDIASAFDVTVEASGAVLVTFSFSQPRSRS